MCGTIGPDLMAVLNGGRSPSAVGNQPEYDLETSGVCCRCAADDGWCVITISGDADWEILRHTLGSPAWMEEARFATPGTRREHAAELQAALETWTRGIAAPEVLRRLQADGLAAAVVEDARDLRHDPHLLARGFFTTARHPLFGETTLDASPIRLSRQPAAWYRLSPALGADNEYVFGEILGLSPADMARCETEEIIG